MSRNLGASSFEAAHDFQALSEFNSDIPPETQAPAIRKWNSEASAKKDPYYGEHRIGFKNEVEPKSHVIECSELVSFTTAVAVSRSASFLPSPSTCNLDSARASSKQLGSTTYRTTSTILSLRKSASLLGLPPLTSGMLVLFSTADTYYLQWLHARETHFEGFRQSPQLHTSR
ncbi:hypothetical protein B9Z19DRAFT_1121625 [Tuber borchii]|uniref:Uncharacterized protein n=1 Tax=Tuber borchii TaxID=42251 RepID=A0A2T7A2E3_TUBBO|nr:hypothetical protein B9Z19DRAFT_1121625 [Tuber borchii]